MEPLLKTIADEPKDFTYLGIGSCPHLNEAGELLKKHDQLLPSCFDELITKEKKSFRILHFDPWFDSHKEFLSKYFEQWNLLRIDSENEQCYKWIGDTIEVTIFPRRIEHDGHFWFFERLVNTILGTKGKLLIQEYTGFELKELNQRLYESVREKEKYKCRILLDMTFGTDLGCCTDMTKAQPYYDYNGNFLNLHFLTISDMKRWIGISQGLDKLIQTLCLNKYYQTLNQDHVNYRRRLRGETCLYSCPEYSDKTSSEDIMRVLQTKIFLLMDTFVAMNYVNNTQKMILAELFQNYREYDPYKWYDAVFKLIPRPDLNK